MSMTLLFLAALSLAPEVPEKVATRVLDSLRSLGGRTADQADNRLTILAILSTECPLSRNQVLSLNRLLTEFSGITVVGLVPRATRDDSGQIALATFRAETGARFPVAGDPDLTWARRLGATVTPEVFLIDSAGAIAYSGAVDDWMITLGRKRPAPTKHYLRDAITDLRVHRPVALRRVPAVGCLIE